MCVVDAYKYCYCGRSIFFFRPLVSSSFSFFLFLLILLSHPKWYIVCWAGHFDKFTYLLTYLLYPNKSTNQLKFVSDIHPGNKHDRLDLTQCAEWPQLAFQFENLAQDKEISDLQNFSPTSSCLKRTTLPGASSLYRSNICHISISCPWPYDFKHVSHVALRTDIIFEFEVSQLFMPVL